MRHLRTPKPEPPAEAEAPKVKWYDRINVSLADRTSWNLKRGDWTLEKFMAEMKTHKYLFVKGRGIITLANVTDIRFFENDGTDSSCHTEFEFA